MEKSIRLAPVLLVLAGAPVAAAAPVATAPGQVPPTPLAGVPTSWRTDAAGRPLGPEAIGKLERGDVLVDLRHVPGERAPHGTALALVDAPPDRVFAICVDYAHFPDFMPYVTHTTIDHRDGERTLVTTTIKLPLGIGRHYQLEYRDGRRTVDGLPVFVSRWRYTGVGDIAAASGDWQIAPFGDGRRSLVRYEVVSDDGGSLPGFIRDSVASSGMRKVVDAVKRRARR